MKLEGKRIIIRDLKLSDIDAFYEYGKSEYVGPNAGWKPFSSKSIAERVLTANIFSKESFAICLKDNDYLIGSISLYNQAFRKNNRAKTLGFSLNHNYWNQGIMTEAVGLMMRHCFNNTDCLILEAGHHVGNYGSKRVIEKSGFNYDGTFNCYKKLYDGRVVDVDFYSITKEEYERKMKNE